MGAMEYSCDPVRRECPTHALRSTIGSLAVPSWICIQRFMPRMSPQTLERVVEPTHIRDQPSVKTCNVSNAARGENRTIRPVTDQI